MSEIHRDESIHIFDERDGISRVLMLASQHIIEFAQANKERNQKFLSGWLGKLKHMKETKVAHALKKNAIHIAEEKILSFTAYQFGLYSVHPF